MLSKKYYNNGILPYVHICQNTIKFTLKEIIKRGIKN